MQEQFGGGTPAANVLVGGVDEVFTRADSQGSSSVLHDGLGSALALTDAAGAVTGEYSYEPFGSTTQAGASANASQYTGRENDQTGLYYYRSRYYSPRLQRFISEDGLDFLAGDTNLYAYAGNDPCNSTDPSGHVVQAAIVACGGGALFDAGMYAGIRWLAGKHFDGEGTWTAAQVGCISGVAGLGAAKAFTGIWRGLKSLKNVVNAGAKLPEREVINFIGRPQKVLFNEGDVLYGVRDAGSRNVWWTRVKPQGELQWRMDQAVLPSWNKGTQLETLTVPKGQRLMGFEGPARGQGPYLGGGNQVYVPNTPSGWSTTTPWP